MASSRSKRSIDKSLSSISSSSRKEIKKMESRPLIIEETVEEYDDYDHEDDNEEEEMDDQIMIKKTNRKRIIKRKAVEETDVWKLPKKVIQLSPEEKNAMNKVKEYFENVIDKHELVIE